MTITNINANENAKLYRAAINGSVPMDVSGKKLFNKAVDRSLIVFPKWQRTETSNEEKITALRNNFDANLMDPLLLVAWPEEHKFHCANGYHRYTATAGMPDMEELPCVILVFDGTLEERKRFEIDLFLKQSISTEPLKAIQMHTARLEINDPAAMAIDKLCGEYGITVVKKKGYRPKRVLGSYGATYKIANGENGSERLASIFKVLDIAGYMETANGLSSRIMQPIGNIVKAYPFAVIELGEMMRTMEPRILASKATSKYPERGWSVQLTLYLQDWIVEKYHVAPRYNAEGKVFKIA